MYVYYKYIGKHWHQKGKKISKKRSDTAIRQITMHCLSMYCISIYVMHDMILCYAHNDNMHTYVCMHTRNTHSKQSENVHVQKKVISCKCECIQIYASYDDAIHCQHV